MSRPNNSDSCSGYASERIGIYLGKTEVSLFDPLPKCPAAQLDVGRVFDVAKVFHCDGLLLCTSADESRFVVWNPFTGETGGSNPAIVPGQTAFLLWDTTNKATIRGTKC
ncbi:unnamed protein product [Microthlaspi erraticum]|uniref:F-box associated beta-propeller type 1 domain-containing protein n=1 Tax=Microthlaspi erraticum TaxID=1685480 RepID=A0A6D2ID02_9BRAS|nr:unnamed protein product [Microthlaspi erraticum]